MLGRTCTEVPADGSKCGQANVIFNIDGRSVVIVHSPGATLDMVHSHCPQRPLKALRTCLQPPASPWWQRGQPAVLLAPAPRARASSAPRRPPKRRSSAASTAAAPGGRQPALRWASAAPTRGRARAQAPAARPPFASRSAGGSGARRSRPSSSASRRSSSGARGQLRRRAMGRGAGSARCANVQRVCTPAGGSARHASTREPMQDES